MARIAGVDIPNAKRVEIGLTYIYGIGRKSSNDILAKTGINPDTRVKDLTEDEVAKLRDEIENSYKVEGDLRRDVALDIKRIVAFVTEKVCRFVGREPKPMQEHARVPQRPLQIRRSKGVT